VELEVFGQHHKYVRSGPSIHGFLLQRVLLTHQMQLYPILQMLRQQVVFNELWKSCIASPFEINKIQVEEDTMQVDTSTDMHQIEIVCDKPLSLQIIFLNPAIGSNNLINLEILVKEGGIIQAQFFPALDEKPPCSSQYITELLNTSHNIPLSLYYIIGKKSTNII